MTYKIKNKKKECKSYCEKHRKRSFWEGEEEDDLLPYQYYKDIDLGEK